MTGQVAFYAPLKSPNHPIPSGDRLIARLMMRALDLAGYEVQLVSETISYQKRPSPDLYETRHKAVLDERQRLIETWDKSVVDRPSLWFTYHPYCKSPDWLGPLICERYGIPYVTAEACRTRQNTDEEWRAGREAVQAAVRLARVNFVLKDSDWTYLESVLPSMATAVRIAPFLDVGSQPESSTNSVDIDFAVDRPLLFVAGMMRPGHKAESYRLLAEALKRVADEDWNLVIAGEGPERPHVEESLSFLAPDRVRFLGSVEHEAMFVLMDRADLFVWPGVGEAIGMAYLEAQSRGLPVAAMLTAGVPLVVSDGVGGLLSPFDNIDSFAATIKRLLSDPSLRQSLGSGGREYVMKHHDVSAVAETFRRTLDPILLAG